MRYSWNSETTVEHRLRTFGLVAGLGGANSRAASLTFGQGQEIPSFARELPSVRTGDPILQFNGKDFSGFLHLHQDHKYEDPGKVFTVHDGMIRISGEEYGGIATGGNFRDYHLIAEWKWGDETWGARESRRPATRDPAPLRRARRRGRRQWMESIECQIIEGGCGDFILVARTQPSPVSPARPASARQAALL